MPVAGGVEDRHCFLGDASQLLGASARPAEEAQERELELRAQLEPWSVRTRSGAGEDRLGALELTGAAERDAELALELEPEGVGFRQQRDCTLEEVDGRRSVAALPRSQAGAAEQRPGVEREACRMRVGRVDVEPETDCPFEVEADELVGPF